MTLAAVRDEVERDVRDARARAASDALYERLRARYSVTDREAGARPRRRGSARGADAVTSPVALASSCAARSSPRSRRSRRSRTFIGPPISSSARSVPTATTCSGKCRHRVRTCASPSTCVSQPAPWTSSRVADRGRRRAPRALDASSARRARRRARSKSSAARPASPMCLPASNGSTARRKSRASRRARARSRCCRRRGLRRPRARISRSASSTSSAGIDHLLFVLGLLLIVAACGASRSRSPRSRSRTASRSPRRRSASCTCRGRPSKPLSRSASCSSRSRSCAACAASRGLTARAPWLVAFTFGLLHGFGFAGRARGDRTAAESDPARAVHVQRRRRDRAAAVRGRGARGGCGRYAAAAAHAVLERVDPALRDRHGRDVLGRGAHRRVLTAQLAYGPSAWMIGALESRKGPSNG